MALPLVNIFFEQIKQIDGFSIFLGDNEAVLIPPKSKYYYMPRIIIKDLNNLQNCLEEYIIAVEESNLKSTKMDEKHDVEYFIGNLTKNITNYDCNNFEDYIKECTDALKDQTFSNFDEKTVIGSLNNNEIIIKRSQEYYGSETPYVIKIIIKNKHMEYELPLIRYSVFSDKNNEKKVKISMIQRKKQYGESEIISDIDKSFSAINSGVKEERNVPPSMVIVLSIFIGLLQSEGISKIIVPDFMNRRYVHFQNVNSENQRDEIQYRATNVFINVFLRLIQHFEGISIESYPNDIDSFLHISLGNKLTCNNSVLENCYYSGLNSQNNNSKYNK